MALLIKKDGLIKSDGSPLIINDNQNDGVLVRFMPQGETKGFNQKLFLQYFTSLEYEQQGFGTIKVLNEDRIELPLNITKEINTFEQLIMNYEECKSEMPESTHPMEIFAYGYHKFIKEKLESILGEDTVIIRLDLM